MPSIPGTLKRANDGVLREIVHKLGTSQIHGSGHEPIHHHTVVTATFVLDGAVIAIIVVAFRDETVEALAG